MTHTGNASSPPLSRRQALKEELRSNDTLMSALRAAIAQGHSPQSVVCEIAPILARGGYPPITAQDIADWLQLPTGVIDLTRPWKGPQP